VEIVGGAALAGSREGDSPGLVGFADTAGKLAPAELFQGQFANMATGGAEFGAAFAFLATQFARQFFRATGKAAPQPGQGDAGFRFGRLAAQFVHGLGKHFSVTTPGEGAGDAPETAVFTLPGGFAEGGLDETKHGADFFEPFAGLMHRFAVVIEVVREHRGCATDLLAQDLADPVWKLFTDL
jgi:hypothetical protein